MDSSGLHPQKAKRALDIGSIFLENRSIQMIQTDHEVYARTCDGGRAALVLIVS